MSYTYRFRYWESRIDKNVKGVEYYDTKWLSDGCNENWLELSFWLGAPQELWTNFLPEIPDSYRVSTTWPSNSFGLEISYIDDFYYVDYSPFKLIDFKRLLSRSERSLSFWLDQEAEELDV